MKNRRSSENPTNSAAQSRFHQVESLSRSDGFVRFQSRRSNRRQVGGMRAWITSGKEDWRRPLPRPSTRTLPDAITFSGLYF
jgi:hypothetical protein